jgi:phosphoribosylanthranilate isomerase
MKRQLRVKVCGMTDPENLEKVSALGPDFLGYIFFRASPRFVGEDPDPALFSIPGKGIIRVGVFVDETHAAVRKVLASGWVDMVQLHGSESPAYCRALVSEGVRVIKALDPGGLDRGESYREFGGVAEYVLYDTPTESYGGSGRKFNWERLGRHVLPVPYFLSGGIGPGDAQLVKDQDLTWLHAVDVNSRFERSPGVKDVDLLRDFINDIRKE